MNATVTATIAFFRNLKPRASSVVASAAGAVPAPVCLLIETGILSLPLLFCLAALVYLAACLYAVCNDYAAFAAWPLRQVEGFFKVYKLDAKLAAWLRDWAFCAWLLLVCLMAAQRPMAERLLCRLNALYLWLGLPVVVALFLFHLGGAWAAPDRILSYGPIAVAGVIPFSDASNHYQYPIEFAFKGIFHEWIMRRPLAAVMRLGLDFLAGWNPFRIITLQTVLQGFSSWLLGLAVLRRWGFFAAVCACAFAFLISKFYLSTFLVEPLGMIWACLFLTLCLDALYEENARTAFYALAALTVTLMVRMGIMFLLPAFLLWIVIRFGGNWRKAARLLCLGLCVTLGVLAASQAISARYSEAGPPGGNFAYTLAALSFDEKNWSVPSKKYSEELSGKTEREQAAFLYEKAFENIRYRPEMLIKALGKRFIGFCQKAPVLMRHYFGNKGSHFFWALLILALWRLLRSPSQQRAFWLLGAAGIAASAAVVYFDEGGRVLSPGYLFLGLFLASGLQLAPAREIPGFSTRRPAVILGGGLLLLMLAAPFLAYKFPPEAARLLRDRPNPILGENETLVWGSGTMTGVLVLPDGVALPEDVHALSLSTFLSAVKETSFESAQPLVIPESPFAFIRPINDSHFAFIAPPEMMYRQDVPLWHVRYADSDDGNQWRRVLEARAIGDGARFSE